MLPNCIKKDSYRCKNVQGFCDPTTKTQATLVWLHEDTCTTFQVSENHTRMIKFHRKNFIEFKSFKKINLIESTHNARNIKIAVPYAGQLLSGNRTNFIDYEGNLTWYYTCTKNFHHFMFLKIKDATNAYLYFI